MPNPLVSVCICQLGRPASLARCLNSIAANTHDYPDYGVILAWDRWENRQGCPRTLAKAVARARGEYIAFIGNDCVARPGWLRIAMEHMAVDFPDGVGLEGFNDLFWQDGRCLHWVGSRALLPMLDGFFFNPQYSHVGTDDEMIGRLRKSGLYRWCPEAIVEHRHFSTGAELDRVYQAAWDPEAVARDRALLAERAERMGFTEYLPK